MRDCFGNKRGACKECRTSRPGICCEYEWDTESISPICLNCGCKPVAHFLLPEKVSGKSNSSGGRSSIASEPSADNSNPIIGVREQRPASLPVVDSKEKSNSFAEVSHLTSGQIVRASLQFKSSPPPYHHLELEQNSSNKHSQLQQLENHPRTLSSPASPTQPDLIPTQTKLSKHRSENPRPRTSAFGSRIRAYPTEVENSNPRRMSEAPKPVELPKAHPTGSGETIGFLAYIDGPEEPEVPKLNFTGGRQVVVSAGEKILKKLNIFGDRSDKGSSGSGISNGESPPNSTNIKAWFGVSLQDLAKRPLIDDIPGILALCFQILMKGVETEGLFRIPGGATEVHEMYSSINKGVPVDFASQKPHNICSLLSRFFDELPDPLLTYDLYDSFLHLHDIDPEKKFDLLQELIFMLPDMHAAVLEKLLKLLKRIAEKKDVNKMSSLNLAIVFAPLLLREQQMDQKLAMYDASISQHIMAYIIENATKIDYVSPFLSEKDRIAERRKKRKQSEEWRAKRLKVATKK
eukprot:TRINITY_DN1101_c0_g1_i1.p1 TRINITY_DN1101_c0_g1~~TRINITY_DN1101_c0_g1_i1.p1  ORF type:complete len:520 (+),score=82.72 TRINITY_DN1101_c0_g1_i1:210-1769(+)